MTGGWTLANSNGYTTYRCLNDECQHFKKRKFRRNLFKGVIEGKSWAIAKCPECKQNLEINIMKPTLDEKNLTPTPDEANNYFKQLMKKKFGA